MSLILKYDLGNPHRLPVGYTPLAYIESSGTLWIDTGWLPTGNTQEVNIHFIPTASLSSKSICGGQPASSAPRNFILHSGSYFYTADNYISCTVYNTINLKYHVRMTNNVNSKLATVTVNGTTTNYAYNTATLTTTYTYHLFTNNNGGNKTSQASSCKIYYCNIINNGSMFGEYIPAKRNSDGVVGMFDIVSQTFKTNAGTGAFIAGPEVIVLPYEYLLVEYLESLNGSTTYINTGVKPSETLGTIIKYSNPDFLANVENIFFGASAALGYAGGTNYCMETYKASSGNYSYWAFGSAGVSASTATTISWVSGLIYKISINYNGNGKLIIDDVDLATKTGQTTFPDYNLFLFTRNVAGNPDTSYGKYRNRIYSCLMYTGTTLIRNFISCYRRSDLKPGMYDTVNNVFYTNSGSGEFILGPVIEESSRQLEYNNAGSNYIGIPQNIHHSTSNPSSTLINLGSGDFNGSSSYIQSNSNIGFSGDPNISISAWVKCTDSTWNTDYVGIVGGTTYATGLNWFLMLKSGRPDFDFWSCRVIASNAISLNLWHHIVVTKSPGTLSTSTVKIYVDGLAVAAAAESARVPTIVNTPVQIGRANLTGRFFHGCISDVRIYNNVLTADEVLQIYKGGL